MVLKRAEGWVEGCTVSPAVFILFAEDGRVYRLGGKG